MPALNFGDEQSISVPASLEELGIPLELAEQDEQVKQVEQDFDEEQTVSPALEPCLNIAPPNFAGEQADSVPPSVEELGTPLELVEQAIKEEHVSPAPETDKQANLVPPSVNQQGTLPAPKFRPYHVPDSATHMTPADSRANVVPSRVFIMDFRNLQYRRHVKHLVDYTDLASMGGNTDTSVYAYSS